MTVARRQWLLRSPENHPGQVVLANCLEPDALAGHVRSFAGMLIQLQDHQLPAWIEAATTADLPSLQRFARHLERDLDAVTAGLSLPWTSGVVEGHVNRIKMLNREMFGRAGFELLRKRFLLHT
ncbi:transposase [Streptomyces xanthophaeus]|nr:transposase [Streptomyces xanthophaeus]WST64794.1 transposase [Streptomyces xanthophaeus]